MHAENLIYDASGTTEYKVQRFNDGKCAIVHVNIRFNSTGNISKLTDEELISQIKKQLTTK